MGNIFKPPKPPKPPSTPAMPSIKPQAEEVAIRQQRRKSGFEQTFMGATGKKTTLG